MGNRAGEATTLYNMAMVYEDKGNYAEAIRLLEQVMTIDEAISRGSAEMAGAGATVIAPHRPEDPVLGFPAPPLQGSATSQHRLFTAVR